METGLKWMYVTASSEAEARHIGRQIVEQKLAACVNLIPGMQSIYRWQGTIEEAAEWVMVVKTTADNEQACISLITTLHSYECPCVVSLDIRGGNPEYLEWLEEAVGRGR